MSGFSRETYRVLERNVIYHGDFKLVPIRYEDRYDIMQWRNEQVYHLRQKGLLTKEEQDDYFKNVVAGLFDQEEPNQILFSFMKGEECIGYGGLVHINWMDKNAEISFIMDTVLEKDHFDEYWQIYLKLIEEVAFDQIDLHRIFTYAFDLRPHMYVSFEQAGFVQEARLKDHILYQGEFVDVVIHGKINHN